MVFLGLLLGTMTDRQFVNWREEIQNRNRTLDFGGKKFKIEIDSSIWREEIGKEIIASLAGS
jgi:hypothetical protein